MRYAFRSPMLKVGKVYRFPQDGPCEVLQVNFSRALVRPLRRERRVIETAVGERAAFDAPAGAFSVSARSVFREVEEGRNANASD